MKKYHSEEELKKSWDNVQKMVYIKTDSLRTMCMPSFSGYYRYHSSFLNLVCWYSEIGRVPKYFTQVAYHAIPYSNTPYYTIPCHTNPYHSRAYHATPSLTMSYHTIPCHTKPYHTIPYNAIQEHTIPRHAILYQKVQCCITTPKSCFFKSYLASVTE